MFLPAGFCICQPFSGGTNLLIPMPPVRALCACLLASCLSLNWAFAQNAGGEGVAPLGKNPVLVRDVKFMQTKIGGQENPWNRMQVELQASFNPETKAPADGAKKLLNKQWVDKVKVTVTQIYKPTGAKDMADFSYYRASATILTLEVLKPRSVMFYLPGDIVKRDRLRKEPDAYYVQVEVNGTEAQMFDDKGQLVPDQAVALHKSIQKKEFFSNAKDMADRSASANAGMLRPPYMLLSYDPLQVVPPAPEFIREEASR